MPEEQTDDSPKNSRDSVPERATFWLSLLIVCALFGFLGLHAWRSERPDSAGAQPAVIVRLERARSRRMDATHWTMPITVRNTGNVALEEVQVRATTRDSAGNESEMFLVFNYLAEGATDETLLVMALPAEQARPEANLASFKAQRRARGY